MKTLAHILLSLALVCSAFCKDNTSEAQFIDAVTKALRTQDREAFYKLVCFDRLDADWIANNKRIFEDYFKEARSAPSFTGSIRNGTAFLSSTLPTQEYNQPIIGTYLMHIAPETAMNIPICMKDGAFRIASLMLKPE